jgi:hypothetical protein
VKSKPRWSTRSNLFLLLSGKKRVVGIYFGRFFAFIYCVNCLNFRNTITQKCGGGCKVTDAVILDHYVLVARNRWSSFYEYNIVHITKLHHRTIVQIIVVIFMGSDSKSSLDRAELQFAMHP